MGRIQFTNIIIDEFSSARKEIDRVYVYILTHIHTDHTKGLSNGWNYGPIYCSKITKQLLLQKYNNLPTIKTLQLQTPTEIKMSDTLSVKITFFNANHCFGAVMVLIQGYMGRILYTGDIRFNKQIFKDYYYLYPKQDRNLQFTRCSKKIDILYLDNTFLKKKFNFPTQVQVKRIALQFIEALQEQQKDKKMYVALDLYGKEQVIEYMAEHVNAKIVVTENKMQILRAMQRNLQFYTTNMQEGSIIIIEKSSLKQFLKQNKDQTCLILSGWVNHASYRYNNRVYCLPYSLHSNFQQIHDFVRSIGPHQIYPIVDNCPGSNKGWYDDQNSNKKNVYCHPNAGDNYIEQLTQLRHLYTGKPSKEYKAIIDSCELQKKIMQQLAPSKQVSLKLYLDEIRPIHQQTMKRDKYKLNTKRNEQQIDRIKNQLSLRKAKTKVQIIIDDQNQLIDLSSNVNLTNSKHASSYLDASLQQIKEQKKKSYKLSIDLFDDPIQKKTQAQKNQISKQLFSRVKQKLSKRKKQSQKASLIILEDSLQSVQEINDIQFIEVIARQRSRQKQICTFEFEEIKNIRFLKSRDEINQFVKRNKYYNHNKNMKMGRDLIS